MARFNDQHRKMLQRLLQQPEAEALEAFVDDYMLRNFAQASIKRDDQFNTLWYAAEAEGGKNHITRLMTEMESEAGKVETA
jgi:hypothetical protein